MCWPRVTEEEGKAQPLKVDVDLVLVPVTVRDQLDRLVIGLQRDDFSVYDRGDQQVISHFSTEDAPISLGVIFDTSSSMRGTIPRAFESVVDFFRGANPEDELFLVAFNDRPELLVNFTSSIEDIENQLANLRPNGTTALLDAVYFGLNQMNKAHNERKALLIVSDGGDNHSRYNAREVLSVVSEAGVQIYAMGIFDEAPRGKAERIGPSLLGSITDSTGGKTFPIHNLKDIGDIAERLAIELRNQYLLAYHPTSLGHDGKWHKISVRVTPPPNSPRLRVYAKMGYYAPAR